MSRSLVLIEVEGGMISDVHRTVDVAYHVIDWDAAQMGQDLDELPPEFASEWPELAEAVRKANLDAEDTEDAS